MTNLAQACAEAAKLPDPDQQALAAWIVARPSYLHMGYTLCPTASCTADKRLEALTFARIFRPPIATWPQQPIPREGQVQPTSQPLAVGD